MHGAKKEKEKPEAKHANPLAPANTTLAAPHHKTTPHKQNTNAPKKHAMRSRNVRYTTIAAELFPLYEATPKLAKMDQTYRRKATLKAKSCTRNKTRGHEKQKKTHAIKCQSLCPHNNPTCGYASLYPDNSAAVLLFFFCLRSNRQQLLGVSPHRPALLDECVKSRVHQIKLRQPRRHPNARLLEAGKLA